MAPESLPQFRNRSESVSRLEGFSDTAFGFAITLLVVSLAVPAHFGELLQQLKGLPVSRLPSPSSRRSGTRSSSSSDATR